MYKPKKIKMQTHRYIGNMQGESKRCTPMLWICGYFWTILISHYLKNKGIVFKARWFVRLDITRERPLLKWNDEGIARVISRKHNYYARVLSSRTNQTRFKKQYLYSHS